MAASSGNVVLLNRATFSSVPFSFLNGSDIHSRSVAPSAPSQLRGSLLQGFNKGLYRQSRKNSPCKFGIRRAVCSASLSGEGFREPVFGLRAPGIVGFQAPPPPRLADLDPSTMLLQQRIIFLGGQVDDVSADAIISQLLLLDAQDPTRDIKLFINSPGGSVTAGMGIYDAMKLCQADVSTVCFGLAASMGAFLLSAGTPGKRFCMPNSRVMIHQPLGGAGGSAIDVGLQVREMMYHKVKLNKILSRITGKSEDQIELDTDRDNFLNPWEAVEYGLVDAVIGEDTPGLVAPVGEVKEPPKSAIWDSWTVKQGRERKELPGEERLLQGEKAAPL